MLDENDEGPWMEKKTNEEVLRQVNVQRKKSEGKREREIHGWHEKNNQGKYHFYSIAANDERP